MAIQITVPLYTMSLLFLNDFKIFLSSLACVQHFDYDMPVQFSLYLHYSGFAELPES